MVQAEQRGHYLPLMFEVPKTFVETVQIKTYAKDSAVKEKTFDKSALDTDPADGPQYFSTFFYVKDKNSTLVITVDWDGTSVNGIAPVSYTVDCSNLTLNAENGGQEEEE